MEVTLVGRTSEVRCVPLNDDAPMDVSPGGRPIETKAEQPSKAASPMEVMPWGTVAWPFASGVYKQPAVARAALPHTVHYIVPELRKVAAETISLQS